MLVPSRSPLRWAPAIGALTAVATLGCSDSGLAGPDDAPAGLSRAFGIWSPGANDTCTPEIHDQYAVVGPDGKLYPTWHPPGHPQTGCTFGHEHGRDPRGSDLFQDVGLIPFAYANERLDIWDPDGARHEDHVGHKVEWENDVDMNFGDVGGGVFEIKCDVLVKMHQGTHSKDAFTNNLHELNYNVRCTDGTRLHFTILTNIGTAGNLVASCSGDEINVGEPNPLNSPSGGGSRRIPDRSCVEQQILVPEGERSNFSGALRESWQLSESIRSANGRRLASVGPYFNVRLPSRFYDPSQPDNVGRPIDVCYEVTESGERAQGGACAESTNEGARQGMTFDDPRSRFDGADRDMDINGITVTNADGPEVWYTDPFGGNGRTEPFPGAIKQFIAKFDNSAVTPHGPSIGRDYGGNGVHAPN